MSHTSKKQKIDDTDDSENDYYQGLQAQIDQMNKDDDESSSVSDSYSDKEIEDVEPIIENTKSNNNENTTRSMPLPIKHFTILLTLKEGDWSEETHDFCINITPTKAEHYVLTRLRTYWYLNIQGNMYGEIALYVICSYFAKKYEKKDIWSVRDNGRECERKCCSFKAIEREVLKKYNPDIHLETYCLEQEPEVINEKLSTWISKIRDEKNTKVTPPPNIHLDMEEFELFCKEGGLKL